MSPLTNGTIVSNPSGATVTKTGNGTATITATVAGCTNSFTKTITLGALQPSTYTGVYRSLSYTRYTISISNPTLPASAYTWYSNSALLGTGFSKFYDVYQGSYTPIYYSVNKNDQCGVSSVGGYLYYLTRVNPCLGEPLFSATKASGSGSVVINRLPPCEIVPAIAKTTTSSQLNVLTPSDYEVRLLDFQGTVIKSVNHVSIKTIFNLDVSRVLPGNYSVLIINKGVVEFSQKLRID